MQRSPTPLQQRSPTPLQPQTPTTTQPRSTHHHHDDDDNNSSGVITVGQRCVIEVGTPRGLRLDGVSINPHAVPQESLRGSFVHRGVDCPRPAAELSERRKSADLGNPRCIDPVSAPSDRAIHRGGPASGRCDAEPGLRQTFVLPLGLAKSDLQCRNLSIHSIVDPEGRDEGPRQPECQGHTTPEVERQPTPEVERERLAVQIILGVFFRFGYFSVDYGAFVRIGCFYVVYTDAARSIGED